MSLVERTMDWIRRNRRAAGIAGVVAGIGVLALVIVLVTASGNHPIGQALPDPALSSPTTPAPLPELPTATATTPSAAQVHAQTNKAFHQFGQGIGSGGLQSGTLNMPGLQGGSVYKYLPRHRVTMRITSAAPIGTVGYVVPTSLNNSSGVVKNVGGSWSLTTTAYGDPDYAQLYMQAGARGYPITCTIIVDGRVTEHRSTQGPYGQLICQG